MTKEETLSFLHAYLDGDIHVGNIFPLRELIKTAVLLIEEYESLPKVRGWVSRTEKGMLLYYGQKPIRTRRPGWNTWWVEPDVYCISFPSDVFPEITWESEPVEVELLIRKKQ